MKGKFPPWVQVEAVCLHSPYVVGPGLTSAFSALWVLNDYALYKSTHSLTQSCHRLECYSSPGAKDEMNAWTSVLVASTDSDRTTGRSWYGSACGK